MEYVAKNPFFYHWYPFFVFLLGTGCRIGEVIGIRWDDIDLENRIIDINHSLTYYQRADDSYKCEFRVSLPKTEAGNRRIPMMQQVYGDAGYVLLGYADQGFRVMTTNRNVQSISDFKGQKIRTMENSYHMAYWKALGASPTPMTFSEVYIGLQQGTIDAQENPYEVIVSNKLYEQQDYVVETNHLPHLISLIVSEEFMKGLTDEQQQIIREAAETAKQYAREQSDERIASKIKTIEDSGTQIITLSDEVHEQIRKECQPIYESIEKNVSSDIVDAYLTR